MPDSSVAGSPAGLSSHALRIELSNEVHARPYEQLEAPLRATHLAMLSGDGEVSAERALLEELCRQYGVTPAAGEFNHLSVDLGMFRLRWERHTEFSSYTFLCTAPFQQPFAEPILNQVSASWLERLPGSMLVGLHLAMQARSDDAPDDMRELTQLFATNTVAGSSVADGAAEAWTDFRIHGDGFGRILVHDRGLRSRQAGRLIQRLLEIETYRMMALLALPDARRALPQVTDFDRRLARLADSVTEVIGPQDEQELLGKLTALAAEIERIAASTNYRFGAARAYSRLVQQRIDELRERRIAGLQTFGEFMARRLEPAMQTCETARERLQALSTGVARVSDLLRTRVDVALEAQNRDLLKSMERRARLQLRLQETVEGLSVVVLSYYLMGLVGYGLKAIKAAGVGLDADLANGIALPLVVAAVFLAVARMRRRSEVEDG